MPPAHVVGARHDGNVLLGHVDADGETFGINVREMVFGFFRVLVRHVQAHVVQAMYFHFLVDGTGYDVAWGEAEPLVVFLHEFFVAWATAGCRRILAWLL